MSTTVFVSDLHLHGSRPAATDCFLRFLAGDAGRAEQLYILGDLFESWIGDDDPDPHHRRVIAALRDYVDGGGHCAVMRGNRDFLLGPRFSLETGVQLLDDVVVEQFGPERVALLHGDQLCTDDHRYQAFRRRARNPGLQRLFLAMPLIVRRAVERRLRKQSQAVTAAAPDYIMDVNTEAVAATMRALGVHVLIHGHTHRPAIHHLDLDGSAARRIVLGDWYSQGSVLAWGDGRFELRTFAFS